MGGNKMSKDGIDQIINDSFRLPSTIEENAETEIKSPEVEEEQIP